MVLVICQLNGGGPGVPSIKANIEAIRALPLQEETKAKILGLNAARILEL